MSASPPCKKSKQIPISGQKIFKDYDYQVADYFINNFWCRWSREIKFGQPDPWYQIAGPVTDLPDSIDADHADAVYIPPAPLVIEPENFMHPSNFMLNPDTTLKDFIDKNRAHISDPADMNISISRTTVR